MAELFGFRIERPKKSEGSVPSFTSPTSDDGTIDIAGGGFFGQILDQDGRERTEIDLIRRYYAGSRYLQTRLTGWRLRPTRSPARSAKWRPTEGQTRPRYFSKYRRRRKGRCPICKL